jgi:serine/threonine-protein kinase
VKIGSLVGHYRILGKLGSGGMGAVFLAEHALLGRRAALKALLPGMSHQRGVVERFFDEARATSAIADPGVVQVFDFGYHVDGTPYLVMEFLDGESLQTRIDRRGCIQPPEALRIARQLASSLAAAHAQGIIHRDLKPENLFLVRDAEATGGERTKILDFGVAKLGASSRLTLSGSMLGTPAYMSPEQCRGPSNVEARSDIYAVGCVIFHMLTGRPPFVGVAADVIASHLDELPPVPSEIVEGLTPLVDGLVLRCLAKNPADRYASAAALQQAIEAVAQLDAIELAGPVRMETQPIEANPGLSTISIDACVGPELFAEPPRPYPRLRAALGVGALVGLVGLGLAMEPSRAGAPQRPIANRAIVAAPLDAGVEVTAIDAGVPDASVVVAPDAAPAPPAPPEPEPERRRHHHHRRTRAVEPPTPASPSSKDPYDHR